MQELLRKYRIGITPQIIAIRMCVCGSYYVRLFDNYDGCRVYHKEELHYTYPSGYNNGFHTKNL